MAVFAPSLVLTVTIEAGADDRVEVHLHAGGQGYWIARMAASLGARVTLCTAIGGETGRVVAALADDAAVELAGTPVAGANGCYVHDRRGGEREPIVDIPGVALSRHETDDLYGKALVAALTAGVLVLTGPQHAAVVNQDVYRRLATDARANGIAVVADLSGEPLAAALQGGMTVLKVSAPELREHGLARDESLESLLAAGAALHERGADSVLISRGADGALAFTDGQWSQAVGPKVTPADPRGTGDSMTAAVAAAIARGQPLAEAFRLAVSAGTINASRHGLGSGRRAEIEQLAQQIEIAQLARDGVP